MLNFSCLKCTQYSFCINAANNDNCELWILLFQGKHHSAIQVHKQYMMKTSDILLPLYKISVQYRQLAFTDAEIESLQLLIKVCYLVWWCASLVCSSFYRLLTKVNNRVSVLYWTVVDIQCESKKSPPPRFPDIFSQTVGNFYTKFYVSIMHSYLCRTTNFYSITCNFDKVTPYYVRSLLYAKNVHRPKRTPGGCTKYGITSL